MCKKNRLHAFNWEAWWLSLGGMVAQFWEAWLLSGSAPDCCPAVPARVRIRHLPSPRLTANHLVGCHLRWHLAAG